MITKQPEMERALEIHRIDDKMLSDQVSLSCTVQNGYFLHSLVLMMILMMEMRVKAAY